MRYFAALISILLAILFATVAMAETVQLAWDASPTPNVKYRVYRANAGGGPYVAVSGLVTGLTFTDTVNPPAGIAYYHYVCRAVLETAEGELESVNSNEVFKRFEIAPAAPILLKVTSQGANIQLEWFMEGGDKLYTVWRDTGGGIQLISSTYATSYAEKLHPHIAARYQVRSGNAKSAVVSR